MRRKKKSLTTQSRYQNQTKPNKPNYKVARPWCCKGRCWHGQGAGLLYGCEAAVAAWGAQPAHTLHAFPDPAARDLELRCAGRGVAAPPCHRVLRCSRSGRVPPEGMGVRFLGWAVWLRRAKSCGWSPGGHGAAVSRAGALSLGRRARRESPGAPRDCQQRESAEARQALSAERDAYKPRAAILFLLKGLPFPSPGAQCAAVAAVSPLALLLLGRPPGRQPGAAREVPSGKVPPAPASTALAFSLPPPP